jgi:hypothetical protein
MEPEYTYDDKGYARDPKTGERLPGVPNIKDGSILDDEVYNDDGVLVDNPPSTGIGPNDAGYHASAPDYSEYYAAMSEQLALQTELAERQLAIAERQAEMSEAQFDFYKENFLPSLEELLSQAERGVVVDYAATIAGQMSRSSTDAAKVSQTPLGTGRIVALCATACSAPYSGTSRITPLSDQPLPCR